MKMLNVYIKGDLALVHDILVTTISCENVGSILLPMVMN